ncbi:MULTISPECIES: hypothetical protein [Rhizobium]|jgi:hypothetical protein|uniref:hypothetical protein n=1 Tax=Rhizobium TaxID=379 RepID=UPI00037B1883|nr:hypothetical protein [Rhizobium ruizarguesonis]TBB44193.1 hypothetical protein ELH49_09165 [Rhizobium ruizarguesonis]
MITAPHIKSRSELTSMIIDFTAKGGEVRTFKRGHTSDWTYLRDMFTGFGYELKIDRSFYIVRKIGEKGRPKRLTRVQAIREIDKVLVAHGHQPFMITRHEFLEARP